MPELPAGFRIILVFRPVFGGILILAVQTHLLKRAPPASLACAALLSIASATAAPRCPPLPPPFFPPGDAAALLFAAVVVGFDVAGAAACAGAPEGADFALSFAGGALGVLAAFSVAGGAVIAARVPTSIFKSSWRFACRKPDRFLWLRAQNRVGRFPRESGLREEREIQIFRFHPSR